MYIQFLILAFLYVIMILDFQRDCRISLKHCITHLQRSCINYWFILRPPLITFFVIDVYLIYIISASLYTYLFCAMNNQAKLWNSCISLNPYSCVLSLFSEPCSHNYCPVVDHLPYHVNDVMQCYLYDRQACEEHKFYRECACTSLHRSNCCYTAILIGMQFLMGLKYWCIELSVLS